MDYTNDLFCLRSFDKQNWLFDLQLGQVDVFALMLWKRFESESTDLLYYDRMPLSILIVIRTLRPAEALNSVFFSKMKV